MNTNDWLEGVLFLADKVTRPALENLCAGHEEFQHHSGVGRALLRWEQEGLVQREQKAREVVFRLTDEGRRRVEPFPDVAAHWDKPWDGAWRTFLFDLPSRDQQLRMMLWRWLRDHRFGYLQDSVWVRPHPITQLVQTLGWFKDNPEMFVVFESRRIAGGDNAAIVQGAWDFKFINDRYRQHLAVVADYRAALARAKSPGAIAELLRRERDFYGGALHHDPLLPRCLWPEGYLGPEALQARRALQAAAREQFRARLAAR
jgi:phenylacetic acid degradation operon negative regulatory protein